ncbi:MAG: hypothetical protein JXA21_19515 [Anaerolineae bacterium]|nr:hypothetical protein [Anaerolineae bacterium]
MVGSIGFIVLLILILGGLALLGFGGYALYEGFTNSDAERSMFGDPKTARIVGIVGILLGLGLICAIAAGSYFLVAGVQM